RRRDERVVAGRDRWPALGLGVRRALREPAGGPRAGGGGGAGPRIPGAGCTLGPPPPPPREGGGMPLGHYVHAQHPSGDDPARRFAETVEQVRLIRALGFDSIWGGEHHATPGYHYFPLLPFLQRLAAEAEGLWVGTNLILLPLHNPVEVAEIGAFLDVI